MKQDLNRIAAAAVFGIAAITYLMTIEPTASFWDCGEFIASSYRLEVGHPPGNPVFQLFARFFCIFTDNMHAAKAVNVLSALCSAFTVLLLYLNIVFFAKRISPSQPVAAIGSGAVGALAFCFSDTFWFSAVEAEVYSMSSLFTALVFWAMTKWYEQADEPHSGRWIVLICILIGLSIGVHLLNLLAVPALVFMYFYRRNEGRRFTFRQLAEIFILSCVILAAILFGIIPGLPKAAAYADLFFVNVLGLPFNSGAVFFVTALLSLCFWGIFRTMKQGKVLANTILLCLTVIIIGFTTFSICVIRSSAKTPTNEYQPDNPFTLVRYLNREQYGSHPLVYGECFGAPYEIVTETYWARVGDRYVKSEKPGQPVYDSAGKMLFPRMWDGTQDRYMDFYRSYIGDKGRRIPGTDELKPTFMQNLTFFFDYQMNWMYWRYFMWNFAGRQNDIHSPVPGDILAGNWECGIGFIDRLRLGDQSQAPAYLKENKGKNHYYLLPLLLGLIGMFFQYAKDKRGCWLTFLMFFMTGIAIVIYLNQQPLQVRERDYAYAGSFYFFCIWIGLGVTAMISFISGKTGKSRIASTAVSLAALCIPALMAAENWDDHDRSNRYTAVEMARNHLNNAGPNGILVTHGDNDTFPLWYAQEVENVRTDVRIVNTSLLGTDWHYDQMKYAVNESAPLTLSVGLEQYLYGTNEGIYIYDTRGEVFPLKDVMRVFRHSQAKLEFEDGRRLDYIPSRKFSIPVNKANVLKHGILPEKYADMIPEEIVLTIPQDRTYITKPELFMLDLLSNYQWDRPINFLSAGGDIGIGIKDYLMFDGFSYRFVPIRNKTTIQEHGFSDPEELYRKMKEIYSWDALKRTDWFVDYHNLYTFAGTLSQRRLFTDVAMELLKAGEALKAVEILDMCQECVPEANFPLDLTHYGFTNEQDVTAIIAAYHMAADMLGKDGVEVRKKADGLTERIAEQLLQSAGFSLSLYEYAKDDFERCYYHLSCLSVIADEYGSTALAASIRDRFNALLE